MPEEGMAQQKTWFNNCAIPASTPVNTVGFQLKVPADKVWDIKPFIFFPTGSLAALVSCVIRNKDKPKEPLWPDVFGLDVEIPSSGVVPFGSGAFTGEGSWAFGVRKSIQGGTTLNFELSNSSVGVLRALVVLDIIERPIR